MCIRDSDNVIRDSLKRGKAAGIDNITAERVIYSHPSIVVHLCKSFNLMLKHQYVHSQFGLGIVIPLLKDKNGDVCNSNNYSISPVISKIFESCLLSKTLSSVHFCTVMIYKLNSRKGFCCSTSN